jgi:hypothetical protein
MTVIEDRIRDALANQATAMHVPEARPDEHLARVIQLPTTPRRSRLLMLTAAAGLLVATGVALAQRRTNSPVADSPAAATPFHFETPTVLLDAASVEVDAAGKTFVPAGDLRVEGDPGIPGIPNASTTLELTWHEQGVEQRIYIYFTSDGTDWWANMVNTYDGQTNGDWIEQQGEYFKTPLGQAYVGDLDLPNLKIHGMRLEAFRRSSSCDNPTTPLALVANFPKIDSAVGGYGVTMSVFDTATCTAVPVSPFTFEFTSDDPAVAAVPTHQEVFADYPPTLSRAGLDLVAPGETTIHAVAKDQAGNVVGTADMHVIVRPADPSVPVPTGVIASTVPPTVPPSP